MIGRIITGRYKIIKNIGQGAFGTTYLAIDTQIPQPNECIVKHFTPLSTDPEVLKKSKVLFEREAKTLKQLGTHPQIPTLLAYTEETPDFFIIQEYIEGHDLTQELPSGVPISEDFVTKLLTEIIEVLVIIHAQNVIHRDLKPQNIRRRKKDNKIVIIDFGAVKEIGTQQLGNQQPQTGTIIGTPGYIPREQADGNPVFSSDIYAVGMIGIQALTGKHPINLPIDSRTGKVIWRNDVKFSNKFADVLDKMVISHHQDRYLTAKSALTALEEISHKKWKLPKINPLILKIAPIGLVIAIAIILFLQRSISECGGELSTYQNSEYNLTIKYPQCWQRDDSTDPITGKILTFIQQKQNAKLIISSSEYLGTLDNYQKIHVEDIEKYLEAAEIIEQDATIVGNKPGKKIISTGKNGNDKIKNMYVMTLRGNTAYMITYSATIDDYDRFLPTAEKMIQSLEID
ncbi:serine/threonine-protein kinase [Anabaena catenula]|uniref:non-specific serine/threonine protein kinase n=1 Tax=Anabaena catenula FACHB-362 TaxID=2692877 RepID=A0ABR8J1V1_9NOST|nr:serine/threonine-protein kinase [Anabaena catenula]MBD2691429.1 serine/threonine protein kinase [Anabaena catenula FACHB-362]